MPDARTLSDEQLTQIIEQAKQATGGPWQVVDGGNVGWCSGPDGAYIYAMRPDVGQAMAEEILRLREKLVRLDATQRSMNMKLGKGSVVHVGGYPVELAADTPISTSDGTWELIMQDAGAGVTNVMPINPEPSEPPPTQG